MMNLVEQLAYIRDKEVDLEKAKKGFKLLARDCKFSGGEGKCTHVGNISDDVDRCNSRDCPL